MSQNRVPKFLRAFNVGWSSAADNGPFDNKLSAGVRAVMEQIVYGQPVVKMGRFARMTKGLRAAWRSWRLSGFGFAKKVLANDIKIIPSENNPLALFGLRISNYFKSEKWDPSSKFAAAIAAIYVRCADKVPPENRKGLLEFTVLYGQSGEAPSAKKIGEHFYIIEEEQRKKEAQEIEEAKAAEEEARRIAEAKAKLEAEQKVQAEQKAQAEKRGKEELQQQNNKSGSIRRLMSIKRKKQSTSKEDKVGANNPTQASDSDGNSSGYDSEGAQTLYSLRTMKAAKGETRRRKSFRQALSFRKHHSRAKSLVQQVEAEGMLAEDVLRLRTIQAGVKGDWTPLLDEINAVLQDISTDTNGIGQSQPKYLEQRIRFYHNVHTALTQLLENKGAPKGKNATRKRADRNELLEGFKKKIELLEQALQQKQSGSQYDNAVVTFKSVIVDRKGDVLPPTEKEKQEVRIQTPVAA